MRISFLLIIFFITSCNTSTTDSQKKEITTLTTKDYELIKSRENKALLILFPGGGTTSKETIEEFDIVEKATSNGISLLLMNFNRRLWIEKEDAKKLSELISKTILENDLTTKKIYIGGMSIGGTVSLTLSNYLHESDASIKPNGVFVVDSPIDLYALYQSAEKDIANKDFSEDRLAEPRWIINYFEEEFGGKDSLLSNIQKYAPYTNATKNLSNIENLKTTDLRFYTEPDTLWWQENRGTDFENTNAFIHQKIDELFKDKNWKNTELIQTRNKGYRANGERHPHSWSIVDVDELITWILE